MRRPGLVAVVAAGLLALPVLSGCVGVKTPAQAVSENTQRTAPQPKTGVHLASLTIVELNTDYGLAIAIEPQTATFPAGDSQFSVLNKWHGLAVGEHVERISVLSSDGTRSLYEDETTFAVTPEHLTVTIIEVVTLTAASPGTYWIVIELDGTEMTRYTFRLVAPESGGT